MKKEMLDNENSVQEYTKAVQYIYELISDGTLETGSRLPTERAIAQTLGIGRNSIREALSILHGMGIIERKQGSGNYISGDAGKSIGQIIIMMLTLRRIKNEDICEFRRSMEKTVCGTILRNGMSDQNTQELTKCLRELEAVQRELESYGKESEAYTDCLGRLAAADDHFHGELIKAADNSLMTVIMDAVTLVYRKSIEQVIYSSDKAVIDKLMECHKDIYDGIISSDETKVCTAIDRHYDAIRG